MKTFTYRNLCIFTIAFLIQQIPSYAQKVNTIDPWQNVANILKNIKAPTFAKRDFVITTFGAKGDGVTNSSVAIKKAIEACYKAGGGRVVVPAGKYFTGPIYLKSNVNLHVQKGATLLFSTKPDDYLPLVHTRWEGIDLMNYSPLIYAFKEKNIAITGEGILDGQATNKNWWPWKGRKNYGWIEGTPNQTDNDKRAALFAMAEKDIPIADRKFGNGFYLRPQFVQPYACENILIEGIKIINSPMWVVNPVLCNNVTISKVTIDSDGPNSDGCDPESCKNVLIKDCYFNTGDDCIAIKSGRNRDGRRINIPSENIVIQNCTMAKGHGGIVIGSEISGGAKNIYAENCKIISASLNQPLRIKTSSARGGTIENIYFRNITVDQFKEEAVIITMLYEDKGDYLPTIKNINIDNLLVKKGGKRGIVLEGYPASAITNVKFNNVIINGVETPIQSNNAKGIIWNNTFINGKKIQ